MWENLELLKSLLIALALGILIGAERGIARIHQKTEEKKTFAGIRFQCKEAIFIESGEAIW